MKKNQISGIIVDVCYNIHRALGPGLFESVYEAILEYELNGRNLKVDRQKAIPLVWNEIHLEQGFRADLIVNDSVLIEIKSIETLSPVHFKQVLTYLRLTDLQLGLLINFNETLIKDGIHRLVNNLIED